MIDRDVAEKRCENKEEFCTKKRNVRLKIVAIGCDQCVWPVGVVAGCGHWVGH